MENISKSFRASSRARAKKGEKQRASDPRPETHDLKEFVIKMCVLRTALVSFVIFIVFLSFAGAVTYRSAATTMKNQMGNKCMGIATATATLIERDAGAYRRFIETLDTDSEYYQTLKANMEKIR
ncbi:MAG: hypothetical protein LBR94_03640, partial [Desulfovibrio sp.]|nr:hypothetical protein [Desulfovibrio sp.]